MFKGDAVSKEDEEMSDIDRSAGYEGCTAACFAMPYCLVCGQRKKPRGRSVPVEAESGYCGYDCEGYMQDPQPGHEWPERMPERLKNAK